jgi:hypothetical protein
MERPSSDDSDDAEFRNNVVAKDGDGDGDDDDDEAQTDARGNTPGASRPPGSKGWNATRKKGIRDAKAREEKAREMTELRAKWAEEDKARSVTTLVPIRPRWRGKRRSLRTFNPGVSLRPHHGFNPDTPRRLSTPLLMPFNSTPTFALYGTTLRDGRRSSRRGIRSAGISGRRTAEGSR